MGRAPIQRVEQASQGVLSDGEHVMSTGLCWAAQARRPASLLLLARRKYVVALTNRRVLVFNRRRRGPEAPDLVIGKRYETFTVERVRRRRPLLQVVLRSANGNRLVFEFPRGQRELAGELIARLTPAHVTEPAVPSEGPSSAAPATGEGVDALEDPAFWGKQQ